MHRTILAVGAHADDVEIYFGGTLFKYRDHGYGIVYVQSTNNMSGSMRCAQPGGRHVKGLSYDTVRTMAYRKAECDRAAALFGAQPVHLDHPQRHYTACGADGCGGGHNRELRYGCVLPPGVPPDVPSILTAHEDEASIRRVADLILRHDPEAVFSHGLIERNPEHSATALLVARGFWQAVKSGYRGSLLQAVNARFRELGAAYGRWETWVDVSAFMDRKVAAIQAHISQFPPDFEEGARYHRAVHGEYGKACGVAAAEIFNFVNPPVPGPGDGDLLAELFRNRGCWG